MLVVQNTLVSREILSRKFVCDLNACKGACCVEGESGAPLDQDELEILEKDLDKILPLLPESGRKILEKKGPWIIDSDGDYVTPLVRGKHCAFTVFGTKGEALCGIEKAWKEGKTTFRKPVSCHLYPIRIEAVNNSPFLKLKYHSWKICSAACSLGEKLSVTVFEFLKEPLIRRFGKEWYAELEKTSSAYEKSNKSKKRISSGEKVKSGAKKFE
jgi:hypothetical protein